MVNLAIVRGHESCCSLLRFDMGEGVGMMFWQFILPVANFLRAFLGKGLAYSDQ